MNIADMNIACYNIKLQQQLSPPFCDPWQLTIAFCSMHYCIQYILKPLNIGFENYENRCNLYNTVLAPIFQYDNA